MNQPRREQGEQGERNNLAERIPHRGLMHWLDEAEMDGEEVVARRLVAADHPFVRDGFLLPLALIEMLSQTAACGAAVEAGERVIRRGMLVSVREMVFHRAVGVGEIVTLRGRKERSMGALSLWRMAAAVDKELVAEGMLSFHLEFDSLLGAST